MSGFSIGEVEEITGVKAHTLRYWEEVIPSVAPSKDFGGRRLYTKSNIQTILRLNYLIAEKKFTIEGARNQIISEASLTDMGQVLIPQINEIRSDLIEVYSLLKLMKKGKLNENSK